jgi:hypothetical protein
MPRKPWVPLPHEAELFTEVYIDESSQTKHRYLVLGALIIPLSHSARFETAILAARGLDFPPERADGTPRILKWEKVNAYNFNAYKRVVEAFLLFPRLTRLPTTKDVNIHTLVVDTSVKVEHDRKFSGGDVELGFNKEIYYLCVRDIGRRYSAALFHIYPDRRNTNRPLSQAQLIMNRGMKKHGDKREYPIRRLKFSDPENSQALQVIDIFIGALAYHLNGHYTKPNANPAKKQLSDYILRATKIQNVFASTPLYRKRFTIWHRDYRALRES